jgi:hypothetical protein
MGVDFKENRPDSRGDSPLSCWSVNRPWWDRSSAKSRAVSLSIEKLRGIHEFKAWGQADLVIRRRITHRISQ